MTDNPFMGPRLAPRADVDKGTGLLPLHHRPPIKEAYDPGRDPAPRLVEAIPTAPAGGARGEAKVPAAMRGAPVFHGGEAILRLPGLLTFYDQKRQGACQSFASCWSLSIARKGKRYDAPWVFVETKKVDDDPNTDPKDPGSGCTVESVLDVMRIEGPRPWGATRPDVGQRIGAAFTVRTGELLRSALERARPVIFSLAWFDTFFHATKVAVPGRSPVGPEYWTCIGRELWDSKKGRAITQPEENQLYWADHPKEFGFFGVRWRFKEIVSAADILDMGKQDPRSYGWHAVCCYGYSHRRRAYAVVNNWGASYPPVWFPQEVVDGLIVGRIELSRSTQNGETLVNVADALVGHTWLEP